MIGTQREALTHESRRNRLLRDTGHNLFRTKGKVSEPSICPSCNAVFHKGRWQWESSPPTSAVKLVCPACHRLREKTPAGYLSLKGSFYQEHTDEILNLIRNEEIKANAEHALQRIMAFRPIGDWQMEITTTDHRLARTLGEALYRAYRGDMQYRYEESSNCSWVSWER